MPDELKNPTEQICLHLDKITDTLKHLKQYLEAPRPDAVGNCNRAIMVQLCEMIQEENDRYRRLMKEAVVMPLADIL